MPLTLLSSSFPCQLILLRHLAGIVCGFFLHWGWAVPPLEICSSNVLIGGVFLIGLVWRRRVIPVTPLLTNTMDEEGQHEHEDYLRSLLAGEAGGDDDQDSAHPPLGQNVNGSTDPFMRSKQKKKEREQNEARRKQTTICAARNAIGVVTLASLFVFDWSGSLVLSQCVLLAYFTFATKSSLIVWAYTHSKVESDIIEPEKVRSGMIWRGFFMAATLTVVVDSMSIASWIALPTMISAERPSVPVGLLPISFFMILRTVINLFALLMSSKNSP